MVNKEPNFDWMPEWFGNAVLKLLLFFFIVVLVFVLIE